MYVVYVWIQISKNCSLEGLLKIEKKVKYTKKIVLQNIELQNAE
jgi:hypothetical protein